MYPVCVFLGNMTKTFILLRFLGVSSVLHARLKIKINIVCCWMYDLCNCYYARLSDLQLEVHFTD